MPLKIQKASAGSGKTEYLARRYLQILLERNSDSKLSINPATILATTFTREAAGEILARIFRILANACSNPSSRAQIIEGSTLTLPTSRECHLLLRSLVDSVHQLNVGTIDALFARQARALAPDLGLAIPWEIADAPTTASLAHLTTELLLKKQPALRKEWHILYGFTRRLLFVKKASLLLEKYRFLASLEPLDKSFQEATPPRYLTPAEVVPYQNFLKNFEVPQTLKEKPNSRWVHAIANLQQAFSSKLLLKDVLSLSSLFVSSLPEQLTALEPPTFYGKPIPLEFITTFSPLAEASRAEQCRLEILREHAFLRLVKAYDVLRSCISFNKGFYTFSEIENAVLQTPAHFPKEEIEFRMECSTEHLLLDEYQDTSQRQHDFLSPLVGNVLAKGGDVLVVGDSKQGIYGWRGGKRHLLELLGKDHTLHREESEPLNKSYRSSRAVLAAVNEVFGALKNSETVTAMNAGEPFVCAARQWSLDFQPHEGATRVDNLRGRVLLHETSTNSTAPMEEVIKKTIQIVVAHHQEDPLREIAILVRRTKFIPQLLQGLRHENILASGEGGNPLTDTLAVEVLLSLLLWIDHPGHSAAHLHVQNSPLSILLTEGNSSLRKKLFEQGIASCLRKWSSDQAFQDACSSYEQARLEQLLEMADRFDAQGIGSPTTFVNRVRHERVESPLSRGIRVLSIHAAKGLEFESVILMDLDLDLLATRRDTLSLQTTENKKFFISSNNTLMNLQGRAHLLHKIQEETWAEALSLLYVGMTRAASYLDIVIAGSYERRPTKSMAQWIRVAGLHQHHVDGISWRTMKISNQKTETPSSKDLENNDGPPLASKKFVARKKLFKRLPSREIEKENILLSEKLNPHFSSLDQDNPLKHQISASAYGLFVHELLSRISWNDALPTTAEVLKSNESISYFNHFSNPREKATETADALLLQIKQGKTPLARAFDRSYFLSHWKEQGVTSLELWKERRFAVLLPGKKEHPDTLMAGAFDRVILGYTKKGIAVAATIIDFKTDDLTPEEEPQRTAYYRPQLAAYEEALQKMIPTLQTSESQLVWVKMGVRHRILTK